MFCGYEKRCLDENGRLYFSTKIRKILGSEAILVKRNKKIFIYPSFYKDHFNPSKFFLGSFDKQGRLKIPANFLKGFGKWIVIIGKGNYLEIRPRKKISYQEITLRDAKQLYKKGIITVCDGDRMEVILKTEK
jgi:DNA-binding transcriptional regulator/RsmH inhibitor MraZ